MILMPAVVLMHLKMVFQIGVTRKKLPDSSFGLLLVSGQPPLV
jgi:hypothetical protein